LKVSLSQMPIGNPKGKLILEKVTGETLTPADLGKSFKECAGVKGEGRCCKRKMGNLRVPEPDPQREKKLVGN